MATFEEGCSEYVLLSGCAASFLCLFPAYGLLVVLKSFIGNYKFFKSGGSSANIIISKALQVFHVFDSSQFLVRKPYPPFFLDMDLSVDLIISPLSLIDF